VWSRRAAVDADVDVIAGVPLQVQLLGWQVAVAVDHQPEEQIIHELPRLAHHNAFQNDFIDHLTSLLMVNQNKPGRS